MKTSKAKNSKASKLSVHFSSETGEWATPQAFFDEMSAKYGPFDLDVAANWKNAKCPLYFGQHMLGAPIVDGLTQDWHKGWAYPPIEACPSNPKCWMNPPYGRGIGAWVKKAYEESQRGCLVVALLPARTDTRWFHSYCIGAEVTFIKGRLKFGGAKNSAPFPSMVVVFRPGVQT